MQVFVTGEVAKNSVYLWEHCSLLLTACVEVRMVSTRRVRLTLHDPDGRPAGKWPTVTGALVGETDGAHGKKWYLMRLDQSLSKEFDPLRALPANARQSDHASLLLTPAPPVPTKDVDPRAIYKAIERGQSITVGVMASGSSSLAEKLLGAVPGFRRLSSRGFHWLCSGVLKPE
jgi:hypothetical protein